MNPIDSEKPTLAIEWWPIERVAPYQFNARRISDAAVGKVAASIRSFGWKQPLVVKEDGTVIVGHTRLAAARLLELDKVPVIVADDLTDAQAKAYRIADNRTGEETTWDWETLNVELGELADKIDLSVLGFDAMELAGLFDRDPTDAMPGETTYNVTVACSSEGEREACLELLEQYGYKTRSA